MPERAAKFTVNAPPQELWKFLRDIEALCSCIPGVERVRLVDSRTAELTVKEKVGIVPLIVNLTARIDSEDPPRRLHATASAEHLTLAIDVALQPSGSATELHSLFNVKGEGPLKPVVDRLFERRATERTAQFAEALERRFGARPSEPPTPEGWLAWLWRRLQRLFSATSPPSS
jgi:carbon monoxide dehydrogenase subunit G